MKYLHKDKYGNIFWVDREGSGPPTLFLPGILAASPQWSERVCVNHPDIDWPVILTDFYGGGRWKSKSMIPHEDTPALIAILKSQF
jgi:hypothetical protein